MDTRVIVDNTLNVL